MSRLETRYRRLLRTLPEAYRVRWEDDMVATYLESVRTGDLDEDLLREDYGRPGIADSLAIVRLAVQVRLGASGTDPGPLLWGAALRRYALVGVVLLAAYGTLDLLSEFIRVGIVPWPVPTDAAAPLGVGTGELVWRLTSLTWVAVLLACVFGRPRVARILAVLAVVPAAVLLGVTLVQFRGLFLPIVVVGLINLSVSLTVVVALAAFHADAPAPRRRPWLVAYAVGVVGLAALAFVVTVLHDRGGDLTVLAALLQPAAPVLVFVVVAVRHLVGRSPHGPAWSLALALLAGALVVQVVVSTYVATGALAGGATALAGHVLQLLVVGLLGIALAVRARRRWVLATSAT